LNVTKTRYLNSEVLAALFMAPKDAIGKPEPPNTLYEQRIVSLFNQERGSPQ
jgi:hypothetical protein